MLVTDVIGLCSALDKAEKQDAEIASRRELALTEGWAKFAVELISQQTKVLAKMMAGRR